jgi:hypothetical protein
MDRWKEGWMDRWKDGWMDGWVKRRKQVDEFECLSPWKQSSITVVAPFYGL